MQHSGQHTTAAAHQVGSMTRGYQTFQSSTGQSATSTTEEAPKFTKCDYVINGFLTIFALLAFWIDFGTAVYYSLYGQLPYALLTTVFIVGPTLLVYWFSMMWDIHDEEHSGPDLVESLFAVMLRYMRTMFAGCQANKTRNPEDFIEVSQRQSDACLLSLYSAFLKSAPQVVLQVYIRVENKDWGILTVVLAVKSFVLLANAVTSYDRDMRRYRTGITKVAWTGEILQGLWRLCSILSRIVATVLAARTTDRGTLAGVLLTIIFMGMFVTSLKRVSGSEDEVPISEDFPHNLAVTAAFTFGFSNIHDRAMLPGAMMHFFLMIPLNVLPFRDYLLEEQKLGDLTLVYVAGGIIFGGQVLGLLLMMVYAQCYFSEGAAFFVPFRIIHRKPSEFQELNQALVINFDHPESA